MALGSIDVYLGFNYLINTHKHSFTGELFNQYKKDTIKYSILHYDIIHYNDSVKITEVVET